jgi:hypothetical protein
MRDRTKWIGRRQLLSAWGRVIKLMLSDPRSREALKAQRNVPEEIGTKMAYGLFVGRKPSVEGQGR